MIVARYKWCRYYSLHVVFVVLLALFACVVRTSFAGMRRSSDGLRMDYNPFAKEMVEKYGAPGKTDDEGFNPVRDAS